MHLLLLLLLITTILSLFLFYVCFNAPPLDFYARSKEESEVL